MIYYFTGLEDKIDDALLNEINDLVRLEYIKT